MVIPAILESSLEDIQREIALVDSVAEKVQIDICDGILVDSTTYLDINKIASIKTHTQIEIHLMVKFPYSYMIKADKNSFSKQFTSICTQIEAQEVEEFINYSKSLELKVGLSLAPETSIYALIPFLANIDFVQFMAVHPGKQGQHLIHHVLEKIKLFKMEHPDVITQVDGGINKSNLEEVLKTHVDNVVIGSAIYAK